MAFGTFKVQAGNFNKGQGQWLRNCLRMPTGNPFRPQVIPVDQLLSMNVIDPASNGAQTVEGEFKDGKKFLATMDHDVVAAIRAAMFDVSVGKTYEARFPYRKWKKWEKVTINILLSPIYLFFTVLVIAWIMAPKNETAVIEPMQANKEAPARQSVEDFARTYPTQIDISPNWEKIDIGEPTDRRIDYMIYYKRSPSIAVAQADTSKMVQALLIGLMARGYAPSSENISISVMAVATGQGATGAAFKVYGRSRYSPGRDEIEFLQDIGR